jgi:hypothetical protein
VSLSFSTRWRMFLAKSRSGILSLDDAWRYLTPELLDALEATSQRWCGRGTGGDVGLEEAISAMPALVAAARHRDQLLGDNMALVSERNRVRAAQHDEIVKLRAEVERLRGQQGASHVRDFDPFAPVDQLPADVLADVETERGMRGIERKP